jgi:hypothetical protein
MSRDSLGVKRLTERLQRIGTSKNVIDEVCAQA